MPEALAIAGPLTAPHPIEACYGSAIHCWVHNADEPGDAYRVCFECHHAYQTVAELLAGHNKVLAALGVEPEPETDVGQVFCCPECTHDW